MDYKTAGVDIEAGYESVELMKKYVKGHGGSGAAVRNRRLWDEGEAGISDG